MNDRTENGPTLTCQAAAETPSLVRGARARLRRGIVAQFARPSGPLGRLAGWIMALRPSNRARNAWTVSLLDLSPTDRVLEVGFGPGLALELAARRVTQGQVVGVEHSAAMLAQARRRNASAIRAGRVELRAGTAEALPVTSLPFDKVLAVNVCQFWRDKPAVLAGIRSAMRPGGRIALTVQPRNPGATREDAASVGVAMARALEEAGFTGTRVEELELKPVPAVCALGTP